MSGGLRRGFPYGADEFFEVGKRTRQSNKIQGPYGDGELPGICGEVQTGGGPPGLSETDALPDIREQTGLAGGMLEILYAVYHFCFMIPCSVAVWAELVWRCRKIHPEKARVRKRTRAFVLLWPEACRQVMWLPAAVCFCYGFAGKIPLKKPAHGQTETGG